MTEDSARSDGEISQAKSDIIDHCRRRRKEKFFLKFQYIFVISRSVSLQGDLDAEEKMNVKHSEEKEPILSSIQVTDKPIRSGNIIMSIKICLD